jgi:hypothetical protein
MDSKSGLQGALVKLAEQLLRCDVPNCVVLSASQLLRPGHPDVVLHSDAVRSRLKSFILSKYGEASDGPSAVADFDREVDSLRRMQSRNWQPFLAMLEPLSLSMSQKRDVYAKHFSFPSNSSKTCEDDKKKASFFENTKHEPKNMPAPLGANEITLINDESLWVSNDVESTLLRDLLLVFQV